MACSDPITCKRVGSVDVQRDRVTVALVQDEHGAAYCEWRQDGQVITKRDVDKYFGALARPRSPRFSLRRIFAAVRGWAIRKDRADAR